MNSRKSRALSKTLPKIALPRHKLGCLAGIQIRDSLLVGSPNHIACLFAHVLVTCRKAPCNQKTNRLLRTIARLHVVGNHLRVVSLVHLKNLTVVKEHWTLQRLIRMPTTLLQLIQELLLNRITECLHVLRISRKESTAERATTPLPILVLVVDETLGNLVNLERAKLITLRCPHAIQRGKILPTHALNTDIEPRKVGALKRVLGNDLLEHRIASHTKEILRRRVSLIEVIGLLNAVLPNLCTILCERKVLKRHRIELRLGLEMRRTKRTKHLHIFRLTEDHQVLVG